MYLENLVFDAVDPQRLGHFWADALGLVTLTDEPDSFEARLFVPDGPVLDLCFQPVASPPHDPQRLVLGLNAAEPAGGLTGDGVTDSLLSLGARSAGDAPDDESWTMLLDPEGNAFRVLEPRAEFSGSGPVATVSVDAGDVDVTAEFWHHLTGWDTVPTAHAHTLRHPSARGPLLEIVPESAPKSAGAKNRLHLDLRLEDGDNAEAAAVLVSELGGEEYDGGWGPLPWRTFRDPSGNEVCLLPVPETHPTTPSGAVPD
jgi:hypothetical protein